MSSTKPLLLVVRHGRTALNEGKPRLRAWEDPPIDRMGEMDAEMAAGKLASYGPKMVYHSDLLRDTQTGHIIAAKLGNLPAEPDFRFRTANMGELSGETEDDVRERVLRWYQYPFEPAPSGESYTQFVNRFMAGIEEKLEMARGIEAFCPLVVVTHGRNLAALHAIYSMIPPETADMPFPGGIGVISANLDGQDSFDFLTSTEPVQQDA